MRAVTRTLIAILLILFGYEVINQGPDFQNVLRQSYDNLTIMPKL